MTTHVERSIEVAVPVRTAYDQWTRFEEFPHFMSGVEEVRQVSDAMTHWIAQIAGVRREWDAEIVAQVPDEKVAWAATTGATNAGAVFFDEVGADRTRVRLTLEFEPEGLVERIGDVLDIVDRQAVADLDRFKEFIEKSQGPTAGGWRGTIEDGDVVSESTGQQTNAGAGAATGGTSDGMPGDVIAVGPTGDTKSTLTTEPGGARAEAPVGDETAIGHSGDPVAIDPDAVSNSQSGGPLDSRTAGTAGPTADAAGSSSAGVAGFGADTGLSSDDPKSGVVTGDPGARAASHAGSGTGDLVGAVGTGGHHEAWTDEPGARNDVTEASTDPVGEDWDSAGGTKSRATTGTDEAWASGGSGPGEDRGVRATGEDGVVQRDFADEDISTDDVVARDFANRDIPGEGVVERDFANRDITERDIANRGVTE